jgi:hypothetical protein
MSGYPYISGRPLSGTESRITGYRTVPCMHKTSTTYRNIFLFKGSPTCITLAWAFPSMHKSLSLETRRILNLYCSNVEVDSTVVFAVPGTMSSSNRHVIVHCYMLVFPKLLFSNGCFCTLKIKDFLEN